MFSSNDEAYVAIDFDGEETVFDTFPIRGPKGWFSGDARDMQVKLPSGSIKKLIGREMTWDDEPVKLT